MVARGVSIPERPWLLRLSACGWAREGQYGDWSEVCKLLVVGDGVAKTFLRRLERGSVAREKDPKHCTEG